jgi:hypothetical protein
MVTSRLQRVLQRMSEVPAEQQDEIATIIEDALIPFLDRSPYAGPLLACFPMTLKSSYCACAIRRHRLLCSKNNSVRC